MDGTRAALDRTLWEVVGESRAAQLQSGPSSSAEGRALEDNSVVALYERLVKMGLTPTSPRKVLNLPTVSGLGHTVDVAIWDSTHAYLVELKRRASVEAAMLQAFTAK